MARRKTRKSKSTRHAKTSKHHKKFKLFFVPGVAGVVAFILSGAIGLAVTIFGAALAGSWYMHNKKGR